MVNNPQRRRTFLTIFSEKYFSLKADPDMLRYAGAGISLKFIIRICLSAKLGSGSPVTYRFWWQLLVRAGGEERPSFSFRLTQP